MDILRITHGPDEGFNLIRIDKMSVLELIEKFVKISMKNEDTMDDYISLLNAVDVANRYNDHITLVTLINDICGGKIKKIHQTNNGEGLKRFMFSRTEIKEVYLKHYLTSDIASYFKVQTYVVARWNDLGLISGDKIRGYRIVPIDVGDKFMKNYFTIFQLIESAFPNSILSISTKIIKQMINKCSEVHELVYKQGRSSLFRKSQQMDIEGIAVFFLDLWIEY